MNLRQELWAKAPETERPYPLAYHLLDTAAAAASLWQLWLRPGLRDLIEDDLGPEAKNWVMLLAGLHDIGKANPVFQLQLASMKQQEWRGSLQQRLGERGYPNVQHVPKHRAQREGIRRHERVSAAHLAGDVFLSDEAIGSSLAPVVSLAHHGSFAWDGTRQGMRPFRTLALGEWERARDDLVEVVEAACGVRLDQIPEGSGVVAILLSGLVVLADRLASQQSSVSAAEADLDEGDLDPHDPGEWFKRRQPFFDGLVRNLLGTYRGFANPENEILGEFLPRGAQLYADSSGDGLWIIMAATGSGKTEAFMLRHSATDEPITLLLPTQATTNAMMRRLQVIFQNTGNVAALAHGEAWLNEFYNQPVSASLSDDDRNRGKGGLFPSEFVASRASRLLAPVTVGTIDQALMASLPLKWTHLRLLALANSHVVVDEAHTLDEYQIRLLDPLLRWLGATRVRVTLLSATLPTRHRDAFVNAYTAGRAEVEKPVRFPSVLSVAADPDGGVVSEDLAMCKYSINLELVEAGSPTANHLEWAKEMLQRYPRARVGVIVNTIDRAQEIAIGARDFGVPVVVLHSRMSSKHRQDSANHLEELIGREGNAEGLLVVGTQALEASLDIDLDLLSTDLAPPSSLIQRAGRAWRREDELRAQRVPGHSRLPLRIVRGIPEDPSKQYQVAGTAAPYFVSELERTWRFLQGRTSLAVPEEVQEFVERGTATLEDLEEDMEHEDALFEELAARSLKAQDASGNAIDIDAVLDPEAIVSNLAGLTSAYRAAPDQDSAFPSTRYRDRESQRILIIGEDAATVPGGWTGTREDLERTHSGDRQESRHASRRTARAALAGVMTVSGRYLKSLRNHMTPVENVPALLGVIAGSLPEGMRYDPDVGLISE